MRGGELVGWLVLVAVPVALVAATLRLARARGRGGVGSGLGAALDEVNAAFQPQKPAVTVTQEEAARPEEDEGEGAPPA